MCTFVTIEHKLFGLLVNAWARLKLFKERGWIAYIARGPSDGEYHLQSSINGHSEWPCSTQPLNIPMLNGDQRIQTERQHYMSDWQQVVPSAKYFFRHTPNNVYATELKGPAQKFCGWKAATAYVFPFDSPTTRMDSQSAERFLDLLRAKDRDTLRTASSTLGLIRQDDSPVLPGEMSIARLRNVLSGFCACFRLCKKYKGFQYLGTCRIFCRMGTCPHELCARFLDGDKDVSMACLSEWTQAQEPESMFAADVQLRAKQESALPLPPAAASSTLQVLMQRAKARVQKRVEAGSKNEKLWLPFLNLPAERGRVLQSPGQIWNRQEANCFRNLLKTSSVLSSEFIFKPS